MSVDGLTLNDQVDEAREALAQLQAAGIPKHFRTESFKALARLVDAAEAIARARAAGTAAPTEARRINADVRDTEQASVDAEFAQLRAGNPRMTRNGAKAIIAKRLDLPPRRVREYLERQNKVCQIVRSDKHLVQGSISDAPIGSSRIQE